MGQTVSLVNQAAGGMGGSRGGGSRTRKPVFGTIHEEISWLRSQPGWRAQDQANRLAQRAQRQQQSPLMQAMMRTRFSATGQAYPLGRDILRHGAAMFGRGAMAGGAAGAAGGAAGSSGIMAAILPMLTNPITDVIAGVVAAVASFALSVKMAASSFADLAQKMASMGGTAGQAQAASMFGDARAFQGAIGGGIGAAYAQQAGINIRGGPFGDMNYSQKLLKFQKFVAGSRSYSEARRRSEAVGMPELANSYYLSDNNKAAIGRMADRQSGTAGGRAAAINLETSWGRISKDMDRIKQVILEPILMAGSWIMDKVANIIEFIRNIIDKIRSFFGSDEQSTAARDRHTKAMQDHTRAMNETREVLGGGNRAQRFIPRGVTGRNLDELQQSRLRNAMI